MYQPRAAQNSERKKYGCTLIFPKSDRAALEAKIADVIKAEWGDKGFAMAKSGVIKNPILAGDGKEARSKETGELHPGMGPDVIFIRVQSGEDNAPWVRWKDKNTQETETTVYSGCYGKAVVNAFAWKNPEGGLGVSFGISGFQKLEDGERLGGSGGSDPDKWVETIDDVGSAPESTKGAGAAGLFGS
ncbi:MAG: DUF2815 family protein [Patescibacteria group bacterium]|nr:DUF2815 family protein [Patescibacteria group bacterium]